MLLRAHEVHSQHGHKPDFGDTAWHGVGAARRRATVLMRTASAAARIDRDNSDECFASKQPAKWRACRSATLPRDHEGVEAMAERYVTRRENLNQSRSIDSLLISLWAHLVSREDGPAECGLFVLTISV